MENRQVPSPNAYDFYLAACEAMVDKELPESCSGGCTCEDCDQEPRELTIEEKSALVERNSEALHKLREGFEHEFLIPSNASLKPPEIGRTMGCRWLAKLLHMESEVLSANGDPAGAMSSLLDAMRLGSDLPRGGLIIDAMIGYAVVLIGLSGSWRIIDQLDVEGARVLAHRAESIYRRSWPFAETLQDEKRSVLADLNVQRWYRWRFTLARQCASMPDCIGFLRSLMHVLPLSRPAVIADFERCADEHIALARMPYSAAREQPDPGGNYVSSSILTFGAQSPARIHADSGATQKAFLATALALRAYRLDHGAYPADLSGLVPDYLESVPQDPFAEDVPLCYRIEGDRYILYSIGPDGVDDGGTAIFDPDATFAPRSQYRVHANSKGDIVAGVNH